LIDFVQPSFKGAPCPCGQAEATLVGLLRVRCDERAFFNENADESKSRTPWQVRDLD